MLLDQHERYEVCFSGLNCMRKCASLSERLAIHPLYEYVCISQPFFCRFFSQDILLFVITSQESWQLQPSSSAWVLSPWLYHTFLPPIINHQMWSCPSVVQASGTAISHGTSPVLYLISHWFFCINLCWPMQLDLIGFFCNMTFSILPNVLCRPPIGLRRLYSRWYPGRHDQALNLNSLIFSLALYPLSHTAILLFIYIYIFIYVLAIPL